MPSKGNKSSRARVAEAAEAPAVDTPIFGLWDRSLQRWFQNTTGEVWHTEHAALAFAQLHNVRINSGSDNFDVRPMELPVVASEEPASEEPPSGAPADESTTDEA